MATFRLAKISMWTYTYLCIDDGFQQTRQRNVVLCSSQQVWGRVKIQVLGSDPQSDSGIGGTSLASRCLAQGPGRFPETKPKAYTNAYTHKL